MGSLAGPGVRVLLIGAGRYEDSTLPDLPSVATTVHDLARTLQECCDVPGEQIRTLVDPAGIEELGDAVDAAATEAEDVLVVYYAGHGQLDRRGNLYLATRGTRDAREGLEHRAFEYEKLRDRLRTCRAHTIVVILDCCFSGTARAVSPPLSDLEPPHASGGYLLASAGPEELALAPEGERHTAFGGALIRLLREGDRSADTRWTLGLISDFVERELRERNMSRPHRVVTGHAGDLVLGPNPISNPYPGLTSYRESNARFFFGRDEMTERARSRLAGQRTGAGTLVVAGPSGSGKSSLLAAGLVPALRQRGLPGVPGSSHWPIRTFTPGAHPLRELVEATGATGDAAARLRETLASDPSQLGSAIRTRLDSGEADRRMIVVVDQFEEVFTDCQDSAERDTFVTALFAAAKEGSALVVLGLRADFYPDITAQPWRPEPFENQLIVGAMNEHELRDVIERPARQLDLTLEDGLTERILRDLAVSTSSGRPIEAGVLPLLCYTLFKLWLRGRGTTQLGIAEYDQIGGIWQAVSASAEECFNSLNPAEKDAARSVLTRLVRLGERDTEDTRREVRRGDLPGDEATEQVLREFTTQRLIIRGDGPRPRKEDPTAREETVEIAHVALTTAWPRLRGWLLRGRENNRARQLLEDAAKRWESDGRSPDELLRGEQLTNGLRLRDNDSVELNDTARDFVDASVAEQRRSEAEQRRVTRQRRLTVASLCALIVVVVALVLWANHLAQQQRNNAVFDRITAQADRLARSDASLATQLALTAFRMRPSDDLAATMIARANDSPLANQLSGQLDTFDTVAFGLDGQMLATASREHGIQLWRIRDQNRLEHLGRSPFGNPNYVNSLAFSPDGRMLASTAVDESIQLWSIVDPAHPRLLHELRNAGDASQPIPPNQPLQPGRIGMLAFSPDGRTLAGASRTDQSIRLWNVSDPTRPVPIGVPLTGHQSYINALAFSPDGHTLATASADKTVRLWDVADARNGGTARRVLTGHRSFVDALAFSPDGHTLASTSADGTIRLWDVADPSQPSQELDAEAGDVTAIAFSHDGRMLASGHDDRTIRLWNLADPARAIPLGQPLTGYSSGIRTLAFAPDDHSLASVGSDRAVRLWNLPATVITGPTGAVNALAFSADGRTLASGGADRAVRLWDVSDPANPMPRGTQGTGNEIGAMAVGPDGRTVITNGPGLRMWKWRISDPEDALHPPRSTVSGTLAFRPDGRILAVAGTDQSLSLWRVTGPTEQVPLSQPLPGTRVSYVNAAGFSHSGKLLVHASADRQVRLWNVADPARPVALGRPFGELYNGYVSAVAFSPDDRILATATNLVIQLWDIADPASPRPLGRPLVGHTGGIYALAFSPDGRTLVSGGGDRTIREWNVADPSHAVPLGQPLVGHTGAIHALAFSPDGKVLASAGADHTIRLWQLDVAQTIQRVCDTTHNVLTEAAWREYVSADLPYWSACGS
jgi:WD40 repeat protein